MLNNQIARRFLRQVVVVGAVLAAATIPAVAERVSAPIAEFTGLDKITGRIISFDVYIDETVQFGSLQVTPKVCYMRTPEEPPNTSAFVIVNEVVTVGETRELRTIFSRWMFAESPALGAIEHPVYDVWLTRCKMSTDVPPPIR
jgi:hypothetical protein